MDIMVMTTYVLFCFFVITKFLKGVKKIQKLYAFLSSEPYVFLFVVNEKYMYSVNQPFFEI